MFKHKEEQEDLQVRFDENGLVPAVVQDIKTKEVLMVAYMNKESFDMTLSSGRAVFWSRSRKEIWIKGQTSGSYMNVEEIRFDCDRDCLLLLVKPDGGACHTGHRSCFFRKLENGELVEDNNPQYLHDSISTEEKTVRSRRQNPVEGSYTNYLFAKGEDKILKKVGEEAAEVVIAGKNRDQSEIKYEVADLMYHLTVMLVDNNMSWNDIFEEMDKRRN